MNTFALFSQEVSASYSIGEKLETILTTAVGGFVLVFVVLGLIWGILEIFNVVFGKKKMPVLPKEEPTPPPAPVEEASDETAVVAAIMAAIAAHTDKPISSFRVVSFRKKK